MKSSYTSILVIGNSQLAYSIVRALCDKKQTVLLLNEIKQEVEQQGIASDNITFIDHKEPLPRVDWAILVAPENKQKKLQILEYWEGRFPSTTCVTVTSDSVALCLLQEKLVHPDRCFVVNWTAPVETTLFFEVLYNERSEQEHLDQLMVFAKNVLLKDPYKVKGELGYRGRLLASLVREAIYLVENDYANVEDIDRACRNDSGYYLPFSGNLRYMDLMGTYAYGVVMKELNPELDNSTGLSEGFKNRLKPSNQSQEQESSFYTYLDGEKEQWEKLTRDFGGKIRALMDRYPSSVDKLSKTMLSK